MSRDPLRPDRFFTSRRAFLGRSGMALLAAGPVAAWARVAECRSLSFVHTHTGETLTCAYYQAGGYAPSQLARVDHFLRDFRTGEVHRIDPGVLDILFDLKVRTVCDEPFHVISGYRSPQTNAMLRRRSSGVAAHSLHMRGQAIDVRQPGVPTKRLQELALALRRGGVGYYPKSDFVHLDTGRVRFW
jgi:uncharacterized protein YcbK (DUF882 family)